MQSKILSKATQKYVFQDEFMFKWRSVVESKISTDPGLDSCSTGLFS